VVLAGCAPAEFAPAVKLAGEGTPKFAPAVAWSPAGAAPKADTPNEFEARCGAITPVKQETPLWCWAACAQMIHAYYGTEISQKALAERIHGDEPDGSPKVEAAAYHEIMTALNPDVKTDPLDRAATALETTRDGRVDVSVDYMSYAKAVKDRYSINSDVIVKELLSRAPVVVVMNEDPSDETLNHAYLLEAAGFCVEEPTAVERIADDALEGYLLNPASYPKYYGLRWVEAIDPYTGQVVRFDGGEFAKRVRFMISKQRARKILEEETRLLTIH
jgi:hypothetical protein